MYVLIEELRKTQKRLEKKDRELEYLLARAKQRILDRKKYTIGFLVDEAHHTCFGCEGEIHDTFIVVYHSNKTGTEIQVFCSLACLAQTLGEWEEEK